MTPISMQINNATFTEMFSEQFWV